MVFHQMVNMLRVTLVYVKPSLIAGSAVILARFQSMSRAYPLASASGYVAHAIGSHSIRLGWIKAAQNVPHPEIKWVPVLKSTAWRSVTNYMLNNPHHSSLGNCVRVQVSLPKN